MKVTYNYPINNTSDKSKEIQNIKEMQEQKEEIKENKNDEISGRFLIRYLIFCVIIIFLLKLIDKTFM